jgi:hypothetical protein
MDRSDLGITEAARLALENESDARHEKVDAALQTEYSADKVFLSDSTRFSPVCLSSREPARARKQTEPSTA